MEELFNDFITHWPESYHDLDEKRFIRWAILAQRENQEFPETRFTEAGLNDDVINHYLNIYRIVGQTLDVLGE